MLIGSTGFDRFEFLVVDIDRFHNRLCSCVEDKASPEELLYMTCAFLSGMCLHGQGIPIARQVKNVHLQLSGCSADNCLGPTDLMCCLQPLRSQNELGPEDANSNLKLLVIDKSTCPKSSV